MTSQQTPAQKRLAEDASVAIKPLLRLLGHTSASFDISTRDQVGELVEALAKNVPMEWEPLWVAMQSLPHLWVRTTQEMADEMLCCVPPRFGGNGGFLVGEAHHDCPETFEPMYACFRKDGEGRFFARYLTVRQFKAEMGGAL